MNALERLNSHLGTRLADLGKAKQQGRKVIGYAAGGYVPEELVLACGALPMCFIRAGDNAVLNDAGACICRWIDPFWRSQIGYVTSGKDPYYNIADLIVMPMTDNNSRAFTNTVGYYTPERESFIFGIPHVKDASALAYYRHGIDRLRKKLEEFTGVEITDSKLKDAIRLCNRERELLREISLMRKSEHVTVRSEDFVALNHGSFFADKEFMVEVLESFIKEAKDGTFLPGDNPRILLTGSTLAWGDSKVMDIIAASGGMVVMEEFAEGLRPYWGKVEFDGDLMANLAQSYFMDRVCAGWFRPGTERLDFLVRLAKDYKVAGVIWYQLMFRESYKVESYFFPDILKKETGLSMLTVESEYDAAETGPMGTRIETFIKAIKEARHG
jgi:benzoyl-CoA reductase/2-hydroxyglutaryl-CoA dehydratase subunit BcrC/BadD/HgdB